MDQQLTPFIVEVAAREAAGFSNGTTTGTWNDPDGADYDE